MIRRTMRSLFRQMLAIVALHSVLFCTLPQAAAQAADAADSKWTYRIGSRVTQPDGYGYFRFSNVAAPDEFGPGGPGTRPDFRSDFPLRIAGYCPQPNGDIKYAYSEPFRLTAGQSVRVAALTVTSTPIPLPESLTISAPRRTLTAIGQTVPLTVTSKQLVGGTLDVTASSQWTTYRTSNAKIVNVNAEGVCTAMGLGTAFLTATNEGVSSVFQMDVSIRDPLTTITGTVLGPGGAPAAGVSVTVSVDAGGFSSTTLTNAAGMFSVPCVPTLVGGLCLSGYRTGGGQTSYFIAGGIMPVPGGVTATGTHILLVNDSAFVLIPDGIFQMGDSFGEGQLNERPVHAVRVSAFFMQARETTKAEWDTVGTWALANGYAFNPGGGKGTDHPVTDVNWYDVLKWCNARSQKEGLVPCYYTNEARTTVYKTGQVNVTNNQVLWTANGYRLPTEAEWEKAARGGLDGKRFPWGDTISHSLANYWSLPQNAFFDISPTGGYHPKYNIGSRPWTSPVGSFAANGYGLYDMSGNVWEWCWDLYGDAYYRSSPEADPKGDDPNEGALSPNRVFRGGSYFNDATYSRLAFRDGHGSQRRFFFMGFRPARGR